MGTCWMLDAANFIIDGHYPVRELWERARNCWTKILAHDSRSVLVVAHNAVNQALVATAIGTCFSPSKKILMMEKKNLINWNIILTFSLLFQTIRFRGGVF